MNILERLRQRAASSLQHIVLPEGDDPRTVVAAAICVQQKIARITLLGSEETIRSAAQNAGANLEGIEVIDHRKASDFDKMASYYYDLRRAKGICTIDQARKRRSEVINVIALSLIAAVIGYLFFLYVVVHLVGAALDIWPF